MLFRLLCGESIFQLSYEHLQFLLWANNFDLELAMYDSLFSCFPRLSCSCSDKENKHCDAYALPTAKD